MDVRAHHTISSLWVPLILWPFSFPPALHGPAQSILGCLSASCSWTVLEKAIRAGWLVVWVSFSSELPSRRRRCSTLVGHFLLSEMTLLGFLSSQTSHGPFLPPRWFCFILYSENRSCQVGTPSPPHCQTHDLPSSAPVPGILPHYDQVPFLPQAVPLRNLSHPAGLGLRFCISHKLSGAASAWSSKTKFFSLHSFSGHFHHHKEALASFIFKSLPLIKTLSHTTIPFFLRSKFF